MEGWNEKELKYLDYMPQYHLERDKFCVIVKEIFGHDYIELLDAFCYGEFNQCDYFAWWRDEDEFYILHKNSGMMVNWYKHLGRTNTCSQTCRTEEDYREFFSEIKEELTYWKNRNGYK